MDMRYYLIENVMGFENPIDEGNRRNMLIKKAEYEACPGTMKVGTGLNEFTIEAVYYVTPKHDWDIHNCPLIPVDLS